MANKVTFEIDALDKGAVSTFSAMNRTIKETQAETRKENILLEKQIDILKKQNKELKNKPKPTPPSGEAVNPLKVMGGGWSSMEGIAGAGLGALGLSSAVDIFARAAEVFSASVERQKALAKEQMELAAITGPGMLYMSDEDRETFKDSRDEIAQETGLSLEWFDPIQKALYPMVKSMDDLESAMRAIAVASRAGVADDPTLIDMEKKSIEAGLSPGVGTSMLYEASKRTGESEELKSLIPMISEFEDFKTGMVAAIVALKNTDSGKAGEMLSAIKELQSKEGVGELKKKIGLDEKASGEVVLNGIQEFIENVQNTQNVSKDIVLDDMVKNGLLSENQAEAVGAISKVESGIDEKFIENQATQSTVQALENLTRALESVRASDLAYDQKIEEDKQKIQRQVEQVSQMTPEQAAKLEEDRNFADRLAAAGMEEALDEDGKLRDDWGPTKFLAGKALEYEEKGGSDDTLQGLLAAIFRGISNSDTSNKDPKKMEELLAQIAANTAPKTNTASPAAPNRNGNK